MQMDRRAAAGIIFAAPAAAFASSGDSPKQSYFGASPLSAPFGETYTARGNDSLFVKMDETEREIFARIAKQSKEQLTNVRIAAACAHAMSARAGNLDYWPSSALCCPFQHTDLHMYMRQIVDYIAKKDWDRSRTALRLYMYETRKSMTRFNDKTGDTVIFTHVVCM